jgi:hypothetical protein
VVGHPWSALSVRRHGRPPDRAGTGRTTGKETLTAGAAVVLILLLAAEGITIVDLRGLLSPHMFIGLALLPPLALRLLAPLRVVSTVVVLVTGTLLLAAGHRSRSLLELHKLSFIVFAVAFIPAVVNLRSGAPCPLPGRRSAMSCPTRRSRDSGHRDVVNGAPSTA